MGKTSLPKPYGSVDDLAKAAVAGDIPAGVQVFLDNDAVYFRLPVRGRHEPLRMIDGGSPDPDDVIRAFAEALGMTVRRV